jgi:hypothetical protein
MNQRGAFEETIQFWISREDWTVAYVPNRDDSLTLDHAKDMLTRITPEFSEGKLGRWLGWIQAAMVANGLATLDDMKSINTKYAE